MKKKFLLVFGMLAASLFFVGTISAQCGPDGTQPCVTPKPKNSPVKPVTVSPAVKPASRTSVKPKNPPPAKSKKADTSIYDSLRNVNPPKKAKQDNEDVFRSLQLEPENKKTPSAVNDFFPLNGVTLGKTTEAQLRILNGKRSVFTSPDTKEQKIYYTVQGYSFWLNDGVADSVSIFSSDEMPAKWRGLGFDWQMSFKETAALLQKLGYQIEKAEVPPSTWNGEKNFVGHIKAVKNEGTSLTVAINFYFSKQKPSVDSNGTMFYFLTMLSR